MEFCGKRWGNERALARMRGKKVRSLDLFDTSVDDKFLIEVSSRGTLKSLHVVSDLITDAGIVAAAANCRLSSLLLSGVPNVSDRAIPTIANCETLVELYLEGTRITDDALGLLRQLPYLTVLSIDDTRITDAGIHELGSRTIDAISFGNCPIKGTGFESWKYEEKMSFYADGSKLDDDGFATACRSFSTMWNVNISNTSVGDKGIRSLLGQGPTVLHVRGSKVTNSGVKWIINNLPVQGLEVDATQMTEEEADSYPKPRKLDIRIRDAAR